MQTIGLLRKIVHVYENGIKSSCGIVYIYIYIYIYTYIYIYIYIRLKIKPNSVRIRF